MTLGELIVDAVIRSGALQSAEAESDSTIFVWRANAAEQIEAALAEKKSELHKAVNELFPE